MAEKILLIIVNYFNDDEVCSYVRSQVLPDKNTEIEVVVVNNGSNNPVLLQDLAKAMPRVSIAEPGENSGYLKGAWFGLNYYLSSGKPFPAAVILSNSDIVFPDPLIFHYLRLRIASGGFDILGPDVISSFDGEHINPYITLRMSAKKMKLIYFFSMNIMLYSVFQLISMFKHWTGHKFGLSGKGSSKPHSTYGIHGSFMVFAKSFFENGGTLEYPMQLFGEEIFIGETARKLNLRTFFDPGLKVIHLAHSTTGIIKNPRNVKKLHDSYSYLIRTFYCVTQ